VERSPEDDKSSSSDELTNSSSELESELYPEVKKRDMLAVRLLARSLLVNSFGNGPLRFEKKKVLRWKKRRMKNLAFHKLRGHSFFA
jgi:hypothetical protein